MPSSESVPPRRSSPLSQVHLAGSHADAFAEPAHHHEPPQGRRERGDQESVIAARDDPGNGTGGISSEAVGHQPFAGKVGVRLFMRRRIELDAPDESKRVVAIAIVVCCSRSH
jgi:hypothetical protein